MNRHSACDSMKICAGLIVITVGLMLSACSGTVTGQVYLDKNQNGSLDADETGIPYAKILVTRDGNTIAEKYTDDTGSFVVHVKQRSGQLCLETDLTYAQQNLNFIQSSMGKSARVKSLSTEAEGSTDDTTKLEKPAAAEGWIGKQYCRNFKGKGFEVSIPVKIDYEAALSEMPTRLEVKCFAGAECEISIPYPYGCQLDTIYLPKELSGDTAQPGVSFNASLNSVSIDQPALVESAAQKSTDSTSTSGSTTMAVESFNVAVLKLKVKDDAVDTDVSIEPTAQCTGQDTALELQKIPVTIKRDIDLAVYQHTLKTLDLKPGEELNVDVTVDNKGASPLVDGELTFTGPDGAAMHPNPDCALQTSGLATVAICKIDRIDPKSTRSIDFKMKLSDWSSKPSPYSEELTCSADFKESGSQQPVQAKDIALEVKKP